ncbi:MAG: gliding motility-associated C-terminal domain-containing protein [Flavobacteriales bacterium]
MRNILIFLLFAGISAGSLTARGQCGACEFPVQLVANGNFSSGNTGFSSSLNPGSGFFCPLCPEGTYAVGPNAVFYHNGFSGTDHTNPPSGNFFIANSPGSFYSEVWCQSITVQPNTDYTFTFWGRDVTNNSNPHPLAWLHASFNGVFVGDSLICEGGWQAFTTTWNSGGTTSLDLCIVNTQWQTGGNDFGLDDISLTACHTYTLNQTAALGEDLTLCGGEAVNSIGLTPLPGYQYSWTPASGLSSTNIANPVYSLINTGPDPITEQLVLSVDSAGVGCATSDTLLITVLPMQPFALGDDVTLCPGETATLDAGPGWDSIVWTNGGFGQTLTTAVSGTVGATVALGACTASDEIEISAISLPTLNLPDTVMICEGQIATFDAVAGGQWSTGWTGAQLSTGTAGTYSFTYSDGDCITADASTLIVWDYPVFTLSGPEAICEGAEAVLTSTLPVVWTTGETGTSITITTSGYYGATLDNNGCTALEGIDIVAIPLPQVNLPADITFCDSEPVQLGVEQTEGLTYVWSTGDSTASIRIDLPGLYTLEVSNECGTSSDVIQADTYPCDWGLYVPTCVTPNNDGFNEGWQVFGWNVSNVVVTVYNRFGDAVFHTTRMEAWQPDSGVGDDSYAWRVEAIDYMGRPVLKTGFVAVLR